MENCLSVIFLYVSFVCKPFTCSGKGFFTLQNFRSVKTNDWRIPDEKKSDYNIQSIVDGVFAA